MRRVLPVVVVALLGLLGPLAAHAHETGDAGINAATIETTPAVMRAAPPVPPPLALALGLAAGALVTAAASRPRRAVGLALTALLVVFAAETAVHSVHHLGDRAGVTCATAATAGHLAAALDADAPVVHLPLPPGAAVAAPRSSRPAAPSHSLEPARAPPAPIA